MQITHYVCEIASLSFISGNHVGFINKIFIKIRIIIQLKSCNIIVIKNNILIFHVFNSNIPEFQRGSMSEKTNVARFIQ